MGYFSNGTQGAIYERMYCEGCVHHDQYDPDNRECCPIWLLHLMWNYDAVGDNKDTTKETALEMFIPRETEGIWNAPCKMRYVVGQDDAQRME